MANSFKERSIKYINRDFQSLKKDLIQFTQAHHSGAFQDFNETSPGMAILELVAYVGDVLSFYQDAQFLELNQETARQAKNVASFSRLLGYRPSGKRSASGIVSVMVEVPATSQGGEIVPDSSYCPILRAGSRLQGPGSVVFETTTDVYFSASAPTENTFTLRMTTGSQFDTNTGLPTHFAVKKDVEVIAAETKTDVFSIDTFEAFRTIELSESDVVQVLSVVDSDGNEWSEVDYLPQEVVFDASVNDGADSSTVPYVLKLRAVPRRFIVDTDITTGRTKLMFGSGDGVNFDDELVPNVADFALPLQGRTTFTSFSLDPQNFLKTRTLGLSPFNTTLTVSYRTGGGPQTNVPAGAIRSVNDALLEFNFTNLDPSTRSDVIGSIECINPQKTEGGAPAETISEMKANSPAFFAAQNRVVTREDYISRVFSMPARFGKVEKAFVRKDAVNQLALDLHVLTKDENGHLSQATTTLVKNIKKYLSRYRMLTDAVNILQTKIVNLRVDFGIVVSPRYNRNEVLANCLLAVKEELHVDRMQIGQPIIVSDILCKLQEIVGVISVYDVKFKNVFGSHDGGEYSTERIDVQSWIQNGILYCPENAIYELKYPNKDIAGEAK